MEFHNKHCPSQANITMFSKNEFNSCQFSNFVIILLSFMHLLNVLDEFINCFLIQNKINTVCKYFMALT